MFTRTNPEEALSIARATARDAGALLRDLRKSLYRIESKDHSVDLVTECDRQAESLILRRLKHSFPDHRVVGEESGTTLPNVGEDAETIPTWFVDPIDGTTNFVHGLPWYSVSIALDFDGIPTVGVVYLPELDWEFSAQRGSGAFLNGSKLDVSKTSALSNALLATGFPYDRSPFDNIDNVRRLLHSTRGVRRFGAASIDCAMVATGWIDGYWEFQLKPWDFWAGALFVSEAGGRVTRCDQSPICSSCGDVVATNGLLHASLCDLLNEPL